jgi:hypothetical protein
MIIELSLWHDCRAVAGKFRDRRFVDVATATQRRAGRRGYLIVAGRQRCHRAPITARTKPMRPRQQAK